jgi:hypothetical protein
MQSITQPTMGEQMQQQAATLTVAPIPDPEPNLGGLSLTEQGMTGDPAVLVWLAAIGTRGRVW